MNIDLSGMNTFFVNLHSGLQAYLLSLTLFQKLAWLAVGLGLAFMIVSLVIW